MKYIKLNEICAQFEKLAQQKKQEKKIVLDPNKKNEVFWGNFLLSALHSYMYKFRTPEEARKVFDAIAKYKQAPAYGGPGANELRELGTIEQALKDSEQRLKAAGLNPMEVLKSKGAQNLNPNLINILLNNLQVLQDAQDFTKYTHYYLVAPGSAHPNDVIDLDKDTDVAGY